MPPPQPSLRGGEADVAAAPKRKKYITITGASRATAIRDLQDMVEKGVLVKEGALKHTRYKLNVRGRV